MSTSRDVRCPCCNAPVGKPCSGTVRNSHSERVTERCRAKSRAAGRNRLAEIKAKSLEACGVVEDDWIVSVHIPSHNMVEISDGHPNVPRLLRVKDWPGAHKGQRVTITIAPRDGSRGVQR